MGLGISATAVVLLLVGLSRVLDLYSEDMGSLAAQEEARSALQRIEEAIRNSVSPPILVDASGQPTHSPGPAAGVRFTHIAGGAFAVHNSAGANSSHVRLRTENFVPRVGDAVEIPTHGLRKIILKVAAEKATPTVRNLEIEGVLGVELDVAPPSRGDVSIAAYITRSHTLTVENHELRRRPGTRAGVAFDVLARNVESPEPFRLDRGATTTVAPVLIELSCAPSAGLRTRAWHKVVTLRGSAVARAPWRLEP